MKGFARKIAAVSASVIMAVSAFGANISAEEQLRDSWVMTDNGWTYIMPDGAAAGDRLVKIDGVMYQFKGTLSQRYNGWTKSSDGIKRRYADGLPYTGWLKYKNGQRRYCLDGYIATSNMQIGDYLYTFDKDGFYTGKTALTLITNCDRIVSGDADKINVALKNLDGRDYNFGVLNSMERWEKGKWVNCWGDWVGENGEVLAFPSIGLSLANKGDMTELDFPLQLYTNYNLTEGYYRIPIGSWIGNYKNQYECYATFQVVPPVEMKTSEEIYFDSGDGVKVDFTAEIKSDKLESGDFDAHIYRMTADGWKDITEHTYSDGEISTEVVPLDEIKGVTFMSYGMLVKDGTGYYKAVVNTKDGNNEYADYFRIGQLEVTPWLDEYSNKDEKLTVFFDIHNKLDRDVEIHTFAYDIYRIENGKWVDPEEARISYTDVEPGEPLKLRNGEHTTIKVNVYINYDISKLKKGEYAVYISGAGYGKFNIVNNRPDESKYPFACLDANEIEKIRLTEYRWQYHLKYTTRKIKDVVAYLSQVQVGENLPLDVEVEGNIPIGVEIFYKDGTTEEIMFVYNESVKFDGQRYKCNPYTCRELCKLIAEKYSE